MALFEKVTTSGWRRYNEGELAVRRLVVDGGYIYDIEHEDEEASGQGGVAYVLKHSYVFVPNLDDERKAAK